MSWSARHVLRDIDLHVPRPAIQLLAPSPEAARDLAIGHYRSFATMMKLEITVLNSPDTGRNRQYCDKSAIPVKWKRWSRYPTR